jgi:hypothetical protein
MTEEIFEKLGFERVDVSAEEAGDHVDFITTLLILVTSALCQIQMMRQSKKDGEHLFLIQ